MQWIGTSSFLLKMTFLQHQAPSINARRIDPNAMQVDALSNDQRTVYMREGRCFGCGQTGHIQRACPLKGRKATMPFTNSSRNPFRAAAVEEETKESQIRAMLKELSQEKRDEIMKGFV